MMETPILLYSYPCTWIFVDDQERFLNAVEMLIPEEQPYLLWDNPLRCLEYLQSPSHVVESPLMGRGERSEEDLIVRFELDRIAAQISNRMRFSETSVVVSDFAMPGIDGIEFLAEIQDSSVKKILLTGVADEKLAVRAFNSGIIDRFILKSDPDAISKVVTYSRELEKQRFNEIQSSLRNYLPMRYGELLHNRDFEVKFRERLMKLGIVEFYFSSNPWGYYCVDRYGKVYFLLLTDTQLINEKLAELEAKSAPDPILQSLREKKRFAGIFEEFDGDDSVEYEWEFNSVDIEKEPSSALLYWGVHDNPPMDVDFDPGECSLDAYLSAT